jgi:hypothetical protein
MLDRLGIEFTRFCFTMAQKEWFPRNDDKEFDRN